MRSKAGGRRPKRYHVQIVDVSINVIRIVRKRLSSRSFNVGTRSHGNACPESSVLHLQSEACEIPDQTAILLDHID